MRCALFGTVYVTCLFPNRGNLLLSGLFRSFLTCDIPLENQKKWWIYFHMFHKNNRAIQDTLTSRQNLWSQWHLRCSTEDPQPSCMLFRVWYESGIVSEVLLRNLWSQCVSDINQKDSTAGRNGANGRKTSPSFYRLRESSRRKTFLSLASRGAGPRNLSLPSGIWNFTSHFALCFQFLPFSSISTLLRGAGKHLYNTNWTQMSGPLFIFGQTLPLASHPSSTPCPGTILHALFLSSVELSAVPCARPASNELPLNLPEKYLLLLLSLCSGLF